MCLQKSLPAVKAVKSPAKAHGSKTEPTEAKAESPEPAPAQAESSDAGHEEAGLLTPKPSSSPAPQKLNRLKKATAEVTISSAEIRFKRSGETRNC